jgi:hypothetical protein
MLCIAQELISLIYDAKFLLLLELFQIYDLLKNYFQLNFVKIVNEKL